MSKINREKAKEILKDIIEGKIEITQEKPLNKIQIKKELNFVHLKIIEILKKYMDLKEEYYPLISLWIIGTYIHNKFPAYPYLYFNAMRGSGKTRILKLISTLSRNGGLTGSMTEAVLFRTAKDRTLCIDEFENLIDKEKADLRLLLNSAYKKGMKIQRMKRGKEGIQEVEEFEVFCPIAIANIKGMENVLADRCIKVIIEKSAQGQITKLIENFEENPEFILVKDSLNKISNCLNSLDNFFRNLYNSWNHYVVNVVNVVNNVNVVNVVRGNTDNIYDNYDIYDKNTYDNIYKSGLSGRDLEIFFPLYIISGLLGESTLKETLEISQKIVKQRKESDREENKDVQLLEFISQSNYEGFLSVQQVVNEFKENIGEQDNKYITSRGISRALNRLNLITERRSTGKVRQIKIDVLKAKEQIKMFKEPETIPPPQEDIVEYEKIGDTTEQTGGQL